MLHNLKIRNVHSLKGSRMESTSVLCFSWKFLDVPDVKETTVTKINNIVCTLDSTDPK